MVIDTILAVLTGGATGLVGTIIGKVAGYFEFKQKMEFTRLQYGQEVELQKLQHTARVVELESERAIHEVSAAAKTRSASYRHDASYGQVTKWMITALRAVRPLLTFALILMTTVVYFEADLGTRILVTDQILFLTGMSVSWWFGDRSPAYKKR